MARSAAVDRLAAELVDELEVDWVSIPRMPWFAARVLGTTERTPCRDLVVEALVALIDHPEAKVVDGNMRRVFTDPVELREHLAETWPDADHLPDVEVGWLVERDYDVSHRRAD
jgi:hypothetical protein